MLRITASTCSKKRSINIAALEEAATMSCSYKAGPVFPCNVQASQRHVLSRCFNLKCSTDKVHRRSASSCSQRTTSPKQTDQGKQSHRIVQQLYLEYKQENRKVWPQHVIPSELLPQWKCSATTAQHAQYCREDSNAHLLPV